MGFSDLFTVSIAFEQSHLFFPRIIHWLLLIMLVIILVTQGLPYLREVRSGTKSLPFTRGHFDKLRLFGTIGLTVVYFILMQYVGEFFPNAGYGFLFVSMPYMFAISWLYLHHRQRHYLLMAGINAVLTPLIAWYILAQIFYISLP